VIINDDSIPVGYEFFPHVDKVKKFSLGLLAAGKVDFDCFAILDCSNLERCGAVSKFKIRDKPILNIDHHISNENFGSTNWVEPKASSCTEMIYKIYKELKVPLDREAALCLYAGIMTDTGSFRYSNTTSFTHKVVSELLKFNLDIPQIYKQAYENIPFDEMKLLSKVFLGVKREAKGKLIWFQVKQDMLGNKKLSFDLGEQVLTFGRAIKDAEVVVLFKENFSRKHEIRVNFRSHGKVDVNRIAGLFGGGGHKTASGATIKGNIDEVRRKVLAKIKQALK
jgi:phosphoesterase RecJ-like protein